MPAKITLSENAPSEKVVFSLPSADFTLSPGGSFKTDDIRVMGDAEQHPWLAVEREVVEVEPGRALSVSMRPEDDAHSFHRNAEAFDPKAIKAAYQEAVDVSPLAVDANLDQDKKVEEDGVAHTLAADPAHEAAGSKKSSSKDKE